MYIYIFDYIQCIKNIIHIIICPQEVCKSDWLTIRMSALAGLRSDTVRCGIRCVTQTGP